MSEKVKVVSAESRSNLGLYIGAIVILVLAEIASILAINFYRPDKDNTVILAPVTLIIFSIVTSFLNLINGHRTRAEVGEASTKADEAQKISKETGLAVNGRMEKLLEETRLAAYLKGKHEGRDEAVKEMTLLMATPSQVLTAPVVPPTASVTLADKKDG